MFLAQRKFTARLTGIRSISVLVVMLAAFAVIASAQDPTSPTPTPLPTPVITSPSDGPDDRPVVPNVRSTPRLLPSPERVGVNVADQMSLSLGDAIRLALENNNDIDASRNDVEIAEFNLRGARGVYDPLLASEAYYESATTPVASLIGGAVDGAVTNKRLFGSGGVSGFSPYYGGVYSARLDSSRTTTSNTNAFLNPQFPTALAFSYIQPLLRGRSFDNNRRVIEIAKKNLSLTDSQFRQRAIDVIALVEQAYWNLAFALRNEQVQLDAVRQARAQMESNQRLVDQGVLAPIDVVAAAGQMTIFEQNVYAAQEAVTRAENSLKTLMLPDRSNSVWAEALTPVSPISLEPPRIGLEVAVTEALRNRPEITQLEASAEINEIDLRYFRNQTKPQVDLVGTYTTQGLAGSETDRAIDPDTGMSRVPPNLSGGYFSSLGNLIAQDFPTYRVGVTITLPWGNRTAKANLGRTLVEGTRLTNVRAQTEQVIEAEVRNSLQALRSAEARLTSTVATRVAAEQLSASEERQFTAGTTTLFLVLLRQTELVAARGRELEAHTELNKAISEFRRATGTTLSANNVDVSDGRNLILKDRQPRFAFTSPLKRSTDN